MQGSSLYWKLLKFGMLPTCRIECNGLDRNSTLSLLTSRLFVSARHQWWCHNMLGDSAATPGGLHTQDWWNTFVSEACLCLLSGLPSRSASSNVKHALCHGSTSGSVLPFKDWKDVRPKITLRVHCPLKHLPLSEHSTKHTIFCRQV